MIPPPHGEKEGGALLDGAPGQEGKNPADNAAPENLSYVSALPHHLDHPSHAVRPTLPQPLHHRLRDLLLSRTEALHQVVL